MRGSLAALGLATAALMASPTAFATVLAAVRDVGLVGDGKADNYAKFRAACTDARLRGGGVLAFPPGEYKVVLPAGAAELCQPYSHNTFRGVPGRTVIAIASPADEFKMPFRSSRDATTGVRFEGLTIRRSSPWFGCLLALDCGSDFAFRDCIFDGGMTNDAIKTSRGYVFGVYYGATDGTHTLRDVSWQRCEFVGCAPAVGSPNQAFARCQRLSFDRCRFHDNFASDLELNAPNQTVEQEKTNTVPVRREFLQTDFSITNCTFESSRSPGPAGWGVGLAHMARVAISGNTFRGAKTEAIHVEDYSHDVRVVGNHFEHCARNKGIGVVTILTASSHIVVANNQFDQTAMADADGSDTNTYCVYVLAGQEAGKFHQLPNPEPERVLIADNQFHLGWCSGVATLNCGSVTVSGNQFFGAGSVSGTGSSLSYGGSLGHGINAYSSYNVQVTGNLFRGLHSMFKVPEPGSPYVYLRNGMIGDNVVEGCHHGLVTANMRDVVVGNNQFSRCVWPLVVEPGEAESGPISCTGNLAGGCGHGLVAANALVVTAGGNGPPVAPGAGVTVKAAAALPHIPAGIAIAFGPATLTLTRPSARGSREMVGDLVGAPIADGAASRPVSLPLSSVAGHNLLVFANNLDDIVGTYPDFRGSPGPKAAGPAGAAKARRGGP
jgi:hypothetical protein